LEGVAAPLELAQAAAQAGQSALALTDHHRLTGAVEFVEACQTVGVRPLLGLTLDVQPPKEILLNITARPLVLLAMDLTGWTSLCRLSTAAQQAEALSIPFEQLAQNAAGVLCLTGGTRGLLTRLIKAGQAAQAARWLTELGRIFTDRLYVELQRHVPDDDFTLVHLAELAKAQRVHTVATHSHFYLKPEDADLQRVLTAIRLIQPLAELSDESLAPPGAHWLTPAEMAERFADYPEALWASQEIAARCQLELPLGTLHYPEVDLPPGRTAVDLLREKAYAGARERYGNISPDLQARLEHELGVIGERGYAPLFLIMEDVLRYARLTGVPISSRGSAASSLVAHCLGLTSPDPIRLNLYFERFLNPARSTPPDIDTDLCSRRREGVIQYVFDRYGAERVAMVATINRFRERSALRETAKAYDLPPEEISDLVEALPERWWGPAAERRKTPDDPFAALAQRYPAPLYRAVFRSAARLMRMPRHLSVHPGGVVIAPGPMTDRVPTQPANNGLTITQFDMDAIERMGLIKMDLLGIRGLTVLGDVVEALQAAEPRRYAAPLDALESIPDDDLDTGELVRTARTIGCFQIESPGMRDTLKEINARSVDDLMTALALYRPGPLTGGLKGAFVRRYLQQEKVEHLHPALEPLLTDTHGVILYQEQVLRIAHELAGLSLADADLLRRAMSHFDPGKQMKTLQEKFIAGAWAHGGVPPEIGARVWDLMAAFAGYGFPKAHAASYAQVAWRAAWCKAHVPAEFMAAVLANWGGFYPQRVYLTEARRLGLKLHPPHLNHSQREFTVVYQAGEPHLYMGLNQVRELTQRTQQKVLQGRPFHSLQDFLVRVDPRLQEAENLIRVGALDGLGIIPALLRQLKDNHWQSGQFALFDPGAAEGEDWSLAEKVAAQEELLGAGVSAHPLELAAHQIAQAEALSTLGVVGKVGQRVRVAGMRQVWRKSRTFRGDDLYFMTLEDLEGTLEVVIVAEVYRQSRRVLSGSAGPFLVEGVVELDEAQAEPVLRAERILPVN
jgi:DNA-directed DNA polymerase III PolC